MTTRIAILALSLIAAGAANAQDLPAAQASGSSLQGQKAWDFFSTSPAVSRREVPTTGSIAPRPRRSVDRAKR